MSGGQYDGSFYRLTRNECFHQAVQGFGMGFLGGSGLGVVIATILYRRGKAKGPRGIRSVFKVVYRAGLVFGLIIGFASTLKCEEDESMPQLLQSKNILHRHLIVPAQQKSNQVNNNTSN